MLNDVTHDDRDRAAATLHRMRRNDLDPKLRQFGLDHAAQELDGAYLPAARQLIEEGCRGQAVAAAINVARSSGERPDDEAFLALAWRKNAEFEARRTELEEWLASVDGNPAESDPGEQAGAM
jgi:hypothetical protein